MHDKLKHGDEFRLRILANNICENNCSFCLNDFQPKEPGQQVPHPVAIEAIDAYEVVMGDEEKIITISGGEPGLHSQIDTIIKAAWGSGSRVIVNTNGRLFKRATFEEFDEFVDCYHIGIYSIPPSYECVVAPERAQIQTVVRPKQPFHYLCDFVEFFCSRGHAVKMFTDFFASEEERENMEAHIARLMEAYPEFTIKSRFTGVQQNRGPGCFTCDKNCVTLKALWVTPFGETPCPQVIKNSEKLFHPNTFEKWKKVIRYAKAFHERIL